MGVKTVLVESHDEKLKEWKEYITEFDREVSRTAALDLSNLGTPLEAKKETLEEVLDLLAQPPGGTGPKVALIYAHANENGLIMRIADQANSAMSKNLRGISRAWRAIDEIIKLRSGDWSNPAKPVFLIDLPKAVTLFRGLLEELKKLSGEYAGRLDDPSAVKSREQADAWFDKWMDLMGKACLGGGLGETDLRRVCRAMQKVRDAKYDRVEIRACNVGKDQENLNALKEFFGVNQVIAPKCTMFFGKAGVNSNQPSFDKLVKHLGGFRGTNFMPPDTKAFPLNQMKDSRGKSLQVEPELIGGRRNRIISTQAGDVIFQGTEIGNHTFKFKLRLWAPSDSALTKFFDANYKSGYAYTAGRKDQPVGGMWLAHDKSTVLPFLLPGEADYRKFLESSS